MTGLKVTFRLSVHLVSLMHFKDRKCIMVSKFSEPLTRKKWRVHQLFDSCTCTRLELRKIMINRGHTPRACVQQLSTASSSSSMNRPQWTVLKSVKGGQEEIYF